MVLAVEAGGQPDWVAGVEAHVLRHALGKGLAGHVPGELEERDALLGRDTRAPAHVAIDVGAHVRIGEISLGWRVEEPTGRQRLHDLDIPAVDLASLEMKGTQAGPAR